MSKPDYDWDADIAANRQPIRPPEPRQVYLANYLTNADSFAAYLNAGAGDGYALHSFMPSHSAGVWVVMEKMGEEDATAHTLAEMIANANLLASSRDFLQACTPERLDAMAFVLNGYASEFGEREISLHQGRELLTALRTAMERVSDGGGTEAGQ